MILHTSLFYRWQEVKKKFFWAAQFYNADAAVNIPHQVFQIVTQQEYAANEKNS